MNQNNEVSPLPKACAWCGAWIVPPRAGDDSDALVSHGICEACEARLEGKLVVGGNDKPKPEVFVVGRIKNGLLTYWRCVGRGLARW